MSLSPAGLTGAISLAVGAILWVFAPAWAWVPLTFFVVLCLIAPFSPRSGFFLRVLSRGPRDGDRITLTFDDGPDPATTPLLLDLLDEAGARACFFVTGRAAERHPDLLRAIQERGHELGNHSHTHDTLLMLRGTVRLAREVDDAQEVLALHGIRSRIFRPPVGITNPRLRPVLAARDLTCVTFSLRAGDAGNRRIRDLARRLLRRVRPGDVILLHDRAPAPPYSVEEWLAEVRALLEGLKERSLEPVPLSILLNIETSRQATRLES
jgi:peptidoglycan-N-acetylglucosamine deacetylase